MKQTHHIAAIRNAQEEQIEKESRADLLDDYDDFASRGLGATPKKWTRVTQNTSISEQVETMEEKGQMKTAHLLQCRSIFAGLGLVHFGDGPA